MTSPTSAALPAKLHGSITPLSPTTAWRWARCRRLYLLKNLLQLPAVDPGSWNEEGLRIHAILHQLHRDASCRDAHAVDDMVASYSLGDDDRIRGFIARHRTRCPDDADYDGGEVPLARFHREPPPLFTASATIDALWIHDGVLDARDYKTGAATITDLSHDVRARTQAWLLSRRAQAKGLRLRLRYEFLGPEADEDPPHWEPDAEELLAIEEELRTTAEQMRAERDFVGVADATICNWCEYKSICSDAVVREKPAS